VSYLNTLVMQHKLSIRAHSIVKGYSRLFKRIVTIQHLVHCLWALQMCGTTALIYFHLAEEFLEFALAFLILIKITDSAQEFLTLASSNSVM
jgi:hypothetical protein